MTKDQKKVIMIYIGFLVGLISNFIPSSTLQMTGGVIFIATVLISYIIRSKSENESFQHNHMQFLIKTFWIASLILVIGIIAAVIFADHSRIHSVVEGVSQGIVFAHNELNAILLSYAFDNIIVFSLTISPTLIYLAYRIIKGIVGVNKNQKIDNLKNWL